MHQQRPGAIAGDATRMAATHYAHRPDHRQRMPAAVAAVIRSFLAVVDQALLAIHACKALLAELGLPE
jgi:hypothetical protein